MAKSNKKLSKKISEIFHQIMKASVQPPPKALIPSEKLPGRKKNEARNN